MPINRKRDDRVLVCCSARSRSTALGESRFSTGFEATGHQTEIEEKPVQTEAFTSSHLHIHENERVIELLMYGFLSKVTEPNLPILFGVLLHFFNSSSLIIFFNDSSIARFVKKKKILFPIKDSLLIDVNNVYLRTIFLHADFLIETKELKVFHVSIGDIYMPFMTNLDDLFPCIPSVQWPFNVSRWKWIVTALQSYR